MMTKRLSPLVSLSSRILLSSTSSSLPSCVSSSGGMMMTKKSTIMSGMNMITSIHHNNHDNNYRYFSSNDGGNYSNEGSFGYNRFHVTSGDTKWLPFEKKEFYRRRGYTPRYHEKGLLPRLRTSTKPLKGLNLMDKHDPWSKKESVFGQNDYIDILGDGSIHPSRLLTNMPQWLRGFKGDELKMINRQRLANEKWQWSRPKKWDQMKKRVDWLYRYLNLRSKPPTIHRYR